VEGRADVIKSCRFWGHRGWMSYYRHWFWCHWPRQALQYRDDGDNSRLIWERNWKPCSWENLALWTPLPSLCLLCWGYAVSLVLLSRAAALVLTMLSLVETLLELLQSSQPGDWGSGWGWCSLPSSRLGMRHFSSLSMLQSQGKWQMLLADPFGGSAAQSSSLEGPPWSFPCWSFLLSV
jgi:hypothetical protein